MTKKNKKTGKVKKVKAWAVLVKSRGSWVIRDAELEEGCGYTNAMQIQMNEPSYLPPDEKAVKVTISFTLPTKKPKK